MTLESVTPAGWPRGAGYSHAMSGIGRTLFLAGQVGWDPLTQRVVSGDLVAQVAQALDNILAILAAGGAGPQHVARMTWFVTDRAAYLGALKALGAVWRTRFGRHYPAMSVVIVSALIEPDALVEIETTAVIPAQ
jgi:enamine deaminase RidA (YjgF/YER057c/UK114 family)